MGMIKLLQVSQCPGATEVGNLTFLCFPASHPKWGEKDRLRGTASSLAVLPGVWAGNMSPEENKAILRMSAGMRTMPRDQ